MLSSPSSAPAAHARYLGGGESLAEAGTTLSGVQVIAAGNLVGLLDNLLGLGENELDVARVRHVGVDLWPGNVSWLSLPFFLSRGERYTYTTVSTVRASALLGSLVDLDVLDDEGTGVEALGVGVGLGVLEEGEEVLSRLDGPASAGDTESLAYLTCPSVQARLNRYQDLR